MFSGVNQKIISGNLQGQALKFPSTIPQGEYKEPQGVLYIPKYMPKKILKKILGDTPKTPIRNPKGFSIISKDIPKNFLGHTLCVCQGGYPIYYIYGSQKISKTHVNHIAGHILA